MVLEGADLDQEAVNAIVLAVRQEQPGVHDGKVARLAHAARPPLDGRERGRRHLKLVRLRDERRRRLQAAHVGPVAQLGLCVAAQDLIVQRLLDPLGLLLLVHLAHQVGHKDIVVQERLHTIHARE